jgi:predicted HAD superfamily Cof-like phosphohydrolase
MSEGIARTKQWFELAVPRPVPKNVTTQLGCHFEEVVEMIAGFKGNDRITQSMLTQAMISLHGLALHLKADKNGSCIAVSDRMEVLDGICDQLVTGTGLGHMLGLNVVDALDEVNRSNFSKFVDGQPIFDKDMKIAKGPNFFKPNLTPFL